MECVFFENLLRLCEKKNFIRGGMCVLISPSILALNVLLPNKYLASYQLSLTSLWNHRGTFEV